MKKLLFFLLLFPSQIFGEYIIHDKIYESPHNLPCSIEAFLNIPEGKIHRFSLLYRSSGNLEYLESPMMLIGNLKFIAEIPGNFMVHDRVEYYLLLELSNHNDVTFPNDDAIHNPIIIQIDLPKGKTIPITSSEINNFDIVGLSPDIMIISPQPGERIVRRDLFIALSYFGEKDVDPTKVKVQLDGVDVSNISDIDSTYLSIPSNSIIPGIHSVTVNITNKYGQKFDDVSWSFTVLPEKMKETRLIRKKSGSIWTNISGATVDHLVINVGELNVLYEVDLDFLQCKAKYRKSSLENIYDQPQDRYTLDLKNKFLNIKLGDSYPFFDKYALNGHLVRGINFNFNKGPLSLDIIKGNTARAVQGNPSDNAIEISNIDSTIENVVITLSRNNYTFQQELFAAKMDLQFGDHYKWDINFIKVEDNISTVANEIPDAEILISYSDSIFSIPFDSLMENYMDIFGENSSITFPTTNWIGMKPRQNFICGSNMQFGFDDSRIQIKSGFSISFLNRNKWNNLQNISELDTFAVDTTLDGLFLDTLQLDTTINLSQYANYFNFGTNQQPMVPFIFLKDGSGIMNILNMSNLNRYTKLGLRYLGHRVEMGIRRNGPDYYSILNPYLKTNFTETYISDRLNLFQNKLLLYYKWSKITEGLYAEQISPIEIRKSLINIALFPGTGLPTFNFGVSSSHRYNGLHSINIIMDTTMILLNEAVTETVLIDTLDLRIDLIINQFNISMTNQFNLWVDQILTVNILLFDQEDMIAQNHILSSGYILKNASSHSYGLSLKSVYNNYWESTFYLNASYYNIGQSGMDDYQIQNSRHLQFNLANRPTRYITKVNYGLQYSRIWGVSSLTMYNFRIGAESELFKNLTFSLNFDYCIKFIDTENKGASDSFIRAYLRYNFL